MALSLTDQGDLLTALHAIGDERPFATFLDRFRRRVAARAAAIVEQRASGVWREHATSADATPDRAALLAMRRGRALDIDGGARAIRSVSAAGEQWLIATGSVGGFDAVDSALMTNLSPHVAIACANLARIEDQALANAAAEAALARAGVAWSLLDPEGDYVAGRTLPPRQAAALADGLAHAQVASAGDTIALPSPGGALALSRVAVPPIDRAVVFAAHYGVATKEAGLAIAIADGRSIADAAADLGLTLETARHYSKRLYALTGTKGQADLARLVWSGPTALA